MEIFRSPGKRVGTEQINRQRGQYGQQHQRAEQGQKSRGEKKLEQVSRGISLIPEMIKHQTRLGEHRLHHFHRAIAQPGIAVKLNISPRGRERLNKKYRHHKPHHPQHQQESAQTPAPPAQANIQTHHRHQQSHILFGCHSQNQEKDKELILFPRPGPKSKKYEGGSQGNGMKLKQNRCLKRGEEQVSQGEN